ncbi:MAG: peptidylprolyl isomerase [Bacillota bacterium]
MKKESKRDKSRAFQPWQIMAGMAVLLVVILVVINYQSGVVATVNGQRVYRSEFDRKVIARVGNQVLEEIITNILILQEGKKQGITVANSEVDAKLAELKQRFERQYGSSTILDEYMAQSGWTPDDLRTFLKVQIITEKILKPKIQIAEDDIVAYWEEHSGEFDTPEMIKASHILVATEAEAKDIVARLKAGEDFAALAKEKSTDAYSKENGGSLGYFSRGDMTEAFEEAAFRLAVGQISEPVQTFYGWHVIKLDDRKAAQRATIESARAEIEQILVEREIDKLYGPWLAELQEKARITKSGILGGQ